MLTITGLMQKWGIFLEQQQKKNRDSCRTLRLNFERDIPLLSLTQLFVHLTKTDALIERFSFECRKVIGFALSTRCDWLKRFAPPFHPIRSKTKANCDALACIFPRFASATCNYFEL